jgi:hypothetical protein
MMRVGILDRHLHGEAPVDDRRAVSTRCTREGSLLRPPRVGQVRAGCTRCDDAVVLDASAFWRNRYPRCACGGILVYQPNPCAVAGQVSVAVRASDGQKWDSIRDCAAALGVAKSTVKRAMDTGARCAGVRLYEDFSRR